jgi:hypothetical protein
MNNVRDVKEGKKDAKVQNTVALQNYFGTLKLSEYIFGPKQDSV